MLAMIVPLLLLAAGAPSAEDRGAIERRVVEIYRPYTTPDPPTAWDQPIFSAGTAALVGRWREVVPKGELDGLNDGDWLCQCQDWDAGAFQATIVSVAMVDEGTAAVELSIDLGFGGAESVRPATLTLKREQDAWQIDEIVAPSFPDGLRQALRETIAADEALRAGTGG